MNENPVIVEQTINAPVERLWDALTDNDQMKQWYFPLPEFKAEKGFEFSFTGGPDEHRQYTHHCRIVDLVPQKRLSYTWSYEGYAGKSVVTFELIPEEFPGSDREITIVRVTHEGLETFPADVPDLAAHNFEAGWKDILGNSLKKFAEK